MRHPVFLGLREDKPARTVGRASWPSRSPRSSGEKGERRRAARRRPRPQIRRRRWRRAPNKYGLPAGNFTNLDKVFWPEDGYTKGDLLAYYHAVAPFILPYLRDRPLSLNRHPNGIHGPSFFQKDMQKQPPPAFAQTARIASGTRGEDIAYLVCQNEATLLHVGQPRLHRDQPVELAAAQPGQPRLPGDRPRPAGRAFRASGRGGPAGPQAPGEGMCRVLLQDFRQARPAHRHSAGGSLRLRSGPPVRGAGRPPDSPAPARDHQRGARIPGSAATGSTSTICRIAAARLWRPLTRCVPSPAPSSRRPCHGRR